VSGGLSGRDGDIGAHFTTNAAAPCRFLLALSPSSVSRAGRRAAFPCSENSR